MFNFTLVHFSSIIIWSFVGNLVRRIRPPQKLDLLKTWHSTLPNSNSMSMFPNLTNSWAPPMFEDASDRSPQFVFTMQWEREKIPFFLSSFCFRSHPLVFRSCERWREKQKMFCFPPSVCLIALPWARWISERESWNWVYFFFLCLSVFLSVSSAHPFSLPIYEYSPFCKIEIWDDRAWTVSGLICNTKWPLSFFF